MKKLLIALSLIGALGTGVKGIVGSYVDSKTRTALRAVEIAGSTASARRLIKMRKYRKVLGGVIKRTIKKSPQGRIIGRVVR